MEQEVNPCLLEFLDAKDAKDYDKMFGALAKLARQATQKELDDIFAVLDMVPVYGSVEDQVEMIRSQLTMRRKYDGERLR